jgi:hypothetical protein
MTDEPKPEQEYPRSRTGELIREGKEVGKFWASLTSDQVIKLLFALGIVVCGFIFVWQMIQFNKQQIDVVQSRDRAAEAELEKQRLETEKVRMHCASESEKNRMTFASEAKENRSHQLAMEKERQRGELERDKNKQAVDKESADRRMQFESEEKAKIGAALIQTGVKIGEMTKELNEIRMLMKKWPPEVMAFPPTPLTVAPPPKLKAVQ